MSNCNKCADTGWVCEEHPEQKQEHRQLVASQFDSEWVICNGAGMPCTCAAFPHGIIVTSQKNADAYNKIMAESKLKTEQSKIARREFYIWECVDDGTLSIQMPEDREARPIKLREVLDGE